MNQKKAKALRRMARGLVSNNSPALAMPQPGGGRSKYYPPGTHTRIYRDLKKAYTRGGAA